MTDAKARYDAAAEWMAGRAQKSKQLRLGIKNLSDANRIMTEAFGKMSAPTKQRITGRS